MAQEEALHPNGFVELPHEMFSIIAATAHSLGPRLGQLRLTGRKIIETPHYLALTFRGVVPHMTQDTFARDASIDGVYVPLEDCKSITSPVITILEALALIRGVNSFQVIERAPYKTPPLYNFRPPNGESPLRRFIALPEPTLLVLGARRTPPVVAPAATSNTSTTVSICTSVGFRPLSAEDYAAAVERLRPDIAVALADVPHGRALGSKRVVKAVDRSIEWLQQQVDARNGSLRGSGGSTSLFASLLPVSCANQQFYIDTLTQDLVKTIDGLALYDIAPLEDLPEDLAHLPRMAFTEPRTPHDLLQQIGIGFDILTAPFITAATDAGIALDFKFPAKPDETMQAKSLGFDMWDTEHATSLTPLVTGCECYACTNHHRAYVQHLLNAKEMLAWILLQIHNHHTLDRFFAGIRQSIRDDSFEQDVEMFGRIYESQLPEKTGQGPRVRGYQYKSEGPGEAKRNPAPYTALGGSERLPESTPPSVDADADVLKQQGFAE